ncbi:hypothetical protein BDZ89DRAFT_1037134 [Hymenopellis radicata]|nr:hypothetical protein BDZ89DRAFT_1037134 [Hymenopellis radicata]
MTDKLCSDKRQAPTIADHFRLTSGDQRADYTARLCLYDRQFGVVRQFGKFGCFSKENKDTQRHPPEATQRQGLLGRRIRPFSALECPDEYTKTLNSADALAGQGVGFGKTMSRDFNDIKVSFSQRSRPPLLHSIVVYRYVNLGKRSVASPARRLDLGISPSLSFARQLQGIAVSMLTAEPDTAFDVVSHGAGIAPTLTFNVDGRTTSYLINCVVIGHSVDDYAH